MVVVEAAIIGAAGYGLYRGGDEAVKRGKEALKEHERETKRSGQRAELGSKTRARSERISQITNIRNNRSVSGNSGGGNAGTSLTAAASLANSQRFLSSSSRGLGNSQGSSNTNSVEDRHKAVMERLRQQRQEESSKNGSRRGSSSVGASNSDTNNQSGRFNPFRRK